MNQPKTQSLRSTSPLRALGSAVLVALLLGVGGPATGRAQQEADPSAAGRLRTTGGEAIDTQGPWRIDGRRVIYTDTQGRLASIRASLVDLERSLQPEQLAARAQTSKQAPTPEAPEAPALVLEDGDVGTWGSRPTGPAAGGAAPDEAGQAATIATPSESSASGLEVVSWKEIGDGHDSLVIHGTVRNPTRRSVRQVRIRVVLFDESGEKIRSLPARLVQGRLAPGASANFQARFGEFIPYTSVDFLIEGNA